MSILPDLSLKGVLIERIAVLYSVVPAVLFLAAAVLMLNHKLARSQMRMTQTAASA